MKGNIVKINNVNFIVYDNDNELSIIDVVPVTDDKSIVVQGTPIIKINGVDHYVMTEYQLSVDTTQATIIGYIDDDTYNMLQDFELDEDTPLEKTESMDTVDWDRRQAFVKKLLDMQR